MYFLLILHNNIPHLIYFLCILWWIFLNSILFLIVRTICILAPSIHLPQLFIINIYVLYILLYSLDKFNILIDGKSLEWSFLMSNNVLSNQ